MRVAHHWPQLKKKGKKMKQETYIDQIDLSFAVGKMIEEEGYTTEAATEAVDLYKIFLKLCKKYPSVKLVPTKAIDDVWHQHILDTVQYFKDCEEIFGGYMHHDPHFFGTPEYDSSWEATCDLYQNEFAVNLKGSGTTCAFSSCSRGIAGAACSHSGMSCSHSIAQPGSSCSKGGITSACSVSYSRNASSVQ